MHVPGVKICVDVVDDDLYYFALLDDVWVYMAVNTGVAKV